MCVCVCFYCCIFNFFVLFAAFICEINYILYVKKDTWKAYVCCRMLIWTHLWPTEWCHCLEWPLKVISVTENLWRTTISKKYGTSIVSLITVIEKSLMNTSSTMVFTRTEQGQLWSCLQSFTNKLYECLFCRFSRIVFTSVLASRHSFACWQSYFGLFANRKRWRHWSAQSCDMHLSFSKLSVCQRASHWWWLSIHMVSVAAAACRSAAVHISKVQVSCIPLAGTVDQSAEVSLRRQFRGLALGKWVVRTSGKGLAGVINWSHGLLCRWSNWAYWTFIG